MPLRPSYGGEREAYDSDEQEYEKENLGDTGGARGDAAEAEQRSHQCDHEKYHGIMQHCVPLGQVESIRRIGAV